MKKVNKIKAVGYCRVSTPKQVKRCVVYCRTATENKNRSNNIQTEKCLGRARKDKCEITEVITDTGSGMNLKRKGVQELIKFVKEGKIDAVYSTDLCRLSRNLGDAEFLKELFKEYEVKLQLVNC